MQADVEHPEVSYHRPQPELQRGVGGGVGVGIGGGGYGRAYNQSQQPTEEYVELQQKRESDI